MVTQFNGVNIFGTNSFCSKTQQDIHCSETLVETDGVLVHLTPLPLQ